MAPLRTVLIGNDSLTQQCGIMTRDAGHQIARVITRNKVVADWAKDEGLSVISSDSDLIAELREVEFDWLLSVANLDLISDDVLALPNKGAVNFHDGPLPRYAGLNAPVWALLHGETDFAITWHMIAPGVDTGDIISQPSVDIAPNDTALSLNTKCYAAALESFPGVLEAIASDAPKTKAQDISKRSYFAKAKRPPAAGRIDFTRPANEIAQLVRALEHGTYWNPLVVPKFASNGALWLVGNAEPHGDKVGTPGTVIEVTKETLRIATGAGSVTLGGLRDNFGWEALPDRIAAVGDVLVSPDEAQAELLDSTLKQTLINEEKHRNQLEALPALDLPLADRTATSGSSETREVDLAGQDPALLLAVLAAHLCDQSDIPISLTAAGDSTGILSTILPICLNAGDTLGALNDSLKTPAPFAADLWARLAEPVALPSLGVSDQLTPGSVMVLDANGTLTGDTGRISADALDLMAARLSHLAQEMAKASDETAIRELSILPDQERDQLIAGWNATETDFPADQCLHQAFEAQAAKTPNAEALAFEGENLSYAQLNARANQLAHRLLAFGVSPDAIVGLHLPRSADLVIAALAIMKAGGAYLPMDPTYPGDRTAHFIQDSGTKVIVTTTDLAAKLPENTATCLCLDTDTEVSAASEANPDSAVTSAHLAYMIYTSGSTGKPKGVMVEHRNLANFFTGMDARIPHDTEHPGVWLAVTSLSFDISVLELFWTLSRGFKVVISGDESRALVSGDPVMAQSTTGGMEFSLFYWGNDDGVGRDKYRLLLEGAQFADQNGFCAVWTPERHFHAFGGPYPNPSVTGAAVAGMTHNIGVRAGSCVAPLHHTARIAEEWAVIDNLTDGRAGLAIASGWQPDDFVLRPENTPPKNKPAMFQAIADLRKLWAGKEVAFPREGGEMHSVLTQPRPVSKKLNVWVTTAGNPETWKEAGANGCHVLTHLLGQSVAEVGEKIRLYHAALRETGHNPDDFTVTLMLHSFLANTRDEAREIAREPMKDYLRSAAGLIKQYAWAFPAFKKPQGVDNAFQLDLGSLTEEELEGILDFAFERYFNDSGLFGTVEDAMARVEEVKAIGVTEVACLIDYGISVDQVLEGLKPLAQVVAANNGTAVAGPAADDFSIAAQIARHKVTHMQCTPSMAQMLVMNDESRAALSQLDQMLVGGEALPGALAAELTELTGAPVENMYGPTETTIWSTTARAAGGEAVASIGTPIANTQAYILDDAMNPVPVGVAGTLFLGGDGVTRGYWQREELTAERFVEDPFLPNNRVYNTGDLARWAPDGTIDFLGRSDFQVKLRGYRIELGEIESAIDQVPGVQQSVVAVHEASPGNPLLVGYLLAKAELDDAVLRQALAENLPAHMIPQTFVVLDTFPLTPNKKVDRKALPAPGQAAPKKPPATAVSPDTNTQATPLATNGVAKSSADIQANVAAIWSELLGVKEIGANDNFFELGGHSLLAVQTHREIRARLGVGKLSITDIFRAPTLGALAAIVSEKAGAGAPTASPAKPVPPSNKEPNLAETGNSRLDAMAKRRAMRARRVSRN